MKIVGRFLVAFLLFTLPALAENKDLTLFAGVQFPGHISLQSTSEGLTKILDNPTNVGVFGLRYGSAAVFGHEETFAYTPNFLDSNSKSIILNGNLIAQVPTPAVKPYVTVGTGPVFTWGQGPSDIGAKWGINYGGGVKIHPGSVGVRFDARGYSIFNIQAQTLNVVEVSVGVLFGF